MGCGYQYRDHTIFTGNLSHHTAFAINDHLGRVNPTTDIQLEALTCLTGSGYLAFMESAKDEAQALLQDVGSARTIANIMVAPNLATTLKGKSKPLRTAEDGIRFHQLRALAKAIIIGGQTYRSEPYQSCPRPLYVCSKSLQKVESPDLIICDMGPTELVEIAIEGLGAPVLVEGGPQLLHQLIRESKIDKLFITRVPQFGDGDFFDQGLLESHYLKVRSSMVGDSIFELWSLKKSKGF